MLSLNAAADDPEAAIAFLSFWSSTHAQATLPNETGFPPSRTDMAGSAELADPWAAKFASVVPVSRFNLAGQKNFARINDEVFTQLVQSITLGQASVVDAAAQADQQLGMLPQ